MDESEFMFSTIKRCLGCFQIGGNYEWNYQDICIQGFEWTDFHFIWANTQEWDYQVLWQVYWWYSFVINAKMATILHSHSNVWEFHLISPHSFSLTALGITTFPAHPIRNVLSGISLCCHGFSLHLPNDWCWAHFHEFICQVCIFFSEISCSFWQWNCLFCEFREFEIYSLLKSFTG